MRMEWARGPHDPADSHNIALSSDTHALLQPLVELQAGEYVVTVFVSDSGSPVLSAYAQVNVTLCVCNYFGDCKSEVGAVLSSSVGINFIALVIVMASIALLLCKPRFQSFRLKKRRRNTYEANATSNAFRWK